MPEARPRHPPVVLIGRGHRPGRPSFGPEVVVESVRDSLGPIAPGLVEHIEPREVRRVLRCLFDPSTKVLHFLSTGWWSLVTPLVRPLAPARIITTFHGYAPLCSVTGVRAWLRQALSILQARAGLAASDVVVSVSARLAESTRRRVPYADHRIITNGLSPVFPHGDGEQAGSRPRKSLRLLIVGTGPHKGALEVLDALSRPEDGEKVPPWSLTVAGPTPRTPFTDRLEAAAAPFGASVRILPPVPHDRMPALYRDHDILLLWSSSDAFGLVVLEAMACGRIPVVSDRAGVADLVENGRNGFVVPFGDGGALRAVLRRIHEGAHDVSGASLRATAEAHSAREAAARYVDLYRDLLHPPSAVYVVTNACPEYRAGVFRLLARRISSRVFFFSEPGARLPSGTSVPLPQDISEGHVPGIRIPGTALRVTPYLYLRLLRGRYDVLVKCINGKFHVALSFLITRIRRKGFVLWTGLWHDPASPFHRLILPIVYLIYRRADALLVYGTHVRDHLVRAGVDPGRIFLAPQAVDNLRFGRPVRGEEVRKVEQTLSAGGRQIILYAGRLEQEKGVDLLLHACSRLGDEEWVLAVVGEGSLRARLEAQARSLIPGRAVFAGFVKGDDLPAWYRAAVFLVLPSLSTPMFREPWGLVTNEAFNQACPVVVSGAVGAAAGGMVRHEVNGLVFPQGDAEALAQAMRRLLRDGAFARRLGEEGRRTVESWTHDLMVEGFLAAIRAAGRAGVPVREEEAGARREAYP